MNVINITPHNPGQMVLDQVERARERLPACITDGRAMPGAAGRHIIEQMHQLGDSADRLLAQPHTCDQAAR